jgi:hypothetical protein
MASSRAYPGLERKPGGPDNWVEATGGLPSYIERIAKHLHYERGFSIQHAIATAVNTVKRWARKGGVVKYNDPNNKKVTTITAAQAAAAVAQWEAKKARARAGARGGGRGRLSPRSVRLSEAVVDVQALAERANAVTDPVARGHARMQIIDLAMTKDGRKSYKNRGKWKHGFVPVDEDAKTSKAKGSSIAKRRINRLYAGGKAEQASKAAVKRTLEQRAAKGSAHGKQIRSSTGPKGGKQRERVQRVGQSLHADIRDATKTQRARPKTRMEVGKGQRSTTRATQPWGQIPDSEKMIRGGKRYVMTNFNGRNLLTEWVGNNEPADTPTAGDRRYSRVMTSQLEKMSTGELRKLLRSGKNSKEVRSKIRAVLDKKQKRNRSRG